MDNETLRQYRLIVLLLAVGLVGGGMAFAFARSRRTGLSGHPAALRDALSTDRAAQRLLLALLSLGLLAGAVLLFTIGLVYRFLDGRWIVAAVVAVVGLLALPSLFAWRVRPFVAAGPEVSRPEPRAIEPLALVVAALIIGSVVPLAGDHLPALRYGVVIAVLGLAALTFGLGAAWLEDAGAASRDARLAALALWSTLSGAAAVALAAVTTTAQTLDVQRVGAAQANTHIYLLTQPVAALTCFAAVVLAWDPRALTAMLGSGTRWRQAGAGALLAAVAALFASAFLGAGAGPWLPGPAWLVLKSAGIAALVAIAAHRASTLGARRRLRLAWTLVPLALLNYGATVVVLWLRRAP